MKKWHKIVLILSITFLLFISIALADMIPLGRKSVGYCVTIENINQYQDYVFLLYSKGPGVLDNYQIFREGDCLSFYKFSEPLVYAIHKDRFNKEAFDMKLKSIHEKIKQESLNGTMEQKAQEIIQMVKSGQITIYEEDIKKEYPSVPLDEFKNREYLMRGYALHKITREAFAGLFDTSFIKSDVVINGVSLWPENEPTEKIVDVLTISSLTDNKLEIKKSKVIYTYIDGTTEEKMYQTQSMRPEPSRKAIMPWWFSRFWYILLPLVALVIIAVILILRRLRR